MSTGDLLNSNKKFLNNFDIVIASEVIEHVNNRNLFLSDISNLCRSGGIIIFTTINKSFMGIFLAKFLAESILKTLPRDTHDPKKFISPKQLSLEASKHNIILDSFTGFIPTFKVKEISKKPKKYLNINQLKKGKYRATADYISGMTDRYAINLYHNIK